MKAFKRRAFLLLTVWLIWLAWAGFPSGAAAEEEHGTTRITVRGDQNYQPYEFLDSGDPSGFNVELFMAVCEAIGLQPDVSLGPWPVVRRQLEHGRIDALTGMFYSSDRDRYVDFSTPFIVVSHAIVVRKGSSIQDLDDIRDRKIIVQQGDIMHDFALKENLTNKLILVEDQQQALRLLASGKYDCALLGKLQALYLANKLGIDNITAVGTPIEPRKYCFAVREGDEWLLEKLNEGLSIVKTSGRYKEIYYKWFGEFESGIGYRRIFRYGALVLGPLLALLTLAFWWTWSLKRLVNQRTGELQRELENRERAQIALMASEERFRRAEEDYREIFVNALEGIFRTTPDGKLIAANPSLAAIYGAESPEELIRKLHDVREQVYVNPSQRDIFMDALKRDGQIKGFETEIRRIDGSVVHASINARVVRGTDGHIKYIDGFMEDITDKMEAERRESRLQEQLSQAQKMEAVGTLASGIAHDFNNILQAITGYMELLRYEGGDASRIADVEKALERATDLVKRLLTFGRRVRPRLETVNLNDEITQVIPMLERTIPRMIRIDLKLAEGLKQIKGDPNQLEQVVMNLATNARDAMPDGGVLTIETSNCRIDDEKAKGLIDLEPGSYAQLRVSDTGTGMDAETIKHIFEPFFTTKGIGKGSGIGLSTVYGIVKGHRGHIACYSEPGHGAVFNIYLPISAQLSDESREPENAVRELPTGDETLLLADDEQAILEATSAILENRGFNVLTANSGEAALEIYRRERRAISLVILDLGMPGMGGRACLAELVKQYPGIKVIVASGYSSEKNIREIMAAGAARFLRKPYRLADLVTTVRDVIDGEQATAAG